MNNIINYENNRVINNDYVMVNIDMNIKFYIIYQIYLDLPCNYL